MDPGIKLKRPNPKTKANILSKLFFTWTIHIYYKAIKRGLHFSDLSQVLAGDASDKLGSELQANWTEEVRKRNDRNPSLLRAIVRTYFWQYMVYGGFLFVQHVGLRSIQPLVLSYYIEEFEKNEGNTVPMYVAGTILVLISLLVVFFTHHVNYGQTSFGMRLRIAVSSLIYRKSLKLHVSVASQTAIGQVVNLLSNDVSRFDLVFIALHYLWLMPFQFVLITYLVWRQVGVSTLTGVLSLLLFTLPMQSYLGKLTSSLRIKVAVRTDYRITLMNEIITGIQVIKMYAWERPFDQLVRLARLREIKYLTSTSYIRAIYLSFMVFSERLTLFLTITSYVLLGNQIRAEQVFAMAQFFNILQLTMSIFYPMSISYGAEALVAIDRIQEFLELEERHDTTPPPVPSEGGVVLSDVTASWTASKVALEDLNVVIPEGCLCAVIGPVGAGKSAFLHLLLGELDVQKGTIEMPAHNGGVAYASQDAWLFSSNVRNNILFGHAYNKWMYNKVVKVCALQKDLQQLSQGDKTMVGERGATLSGGQRARINLARAVYRDVELYLFDDPLSAVDTHVGTHLFQQCILGYLRGKTRILVTHQLQYLKKADMIILINDGRIQAQGTFDDLMKTELNFTKLIVENVEDVEEPVSRRESISQHELALLSEAAVSDSNQSLVTSYTIILESIDIKTDRASRYAAESEENVGTIVENPLWEYIKSSGGPLRRFTLIFLLLMGQIMGSSCDFWVTYWTEQEALPIPPRNSTVEEVPKRWLSTMTAIYVYLGLISITIFMVVSRSCFYFYLAMCSSKNLHNRIFTALLEAPMRFFNTNPSGRILNRFSKDMGAIDELLPRVLLESVQITLVMCGILVMVLISNWYMVIPMVILGVIFIYIRKWYIVSAKAIKHLEGMAKSPVFSHISSSLAGITTIRAFGAETALKREFDAHQDVHTAAWFLTIMSMVSYGLWIDLICVVFIACTTFSFPILNIYSYVSGSLVGLAISQSLILTGMLQYGIRQTAEVVNQLTSVQRVLQYTSLEREYPPATPCDSVIPSSWPNIGAIMFENLSLYYSNEAAEKQPLGSAAVLKNLNAVITGGEKIGIVGRTGAGKSSLISALFRLALNTGHIYIDGVDTTLIGLGRLRKSISIIPQEPVLFSATLRYNLDPFDDFDDSQLWDVLQEVELKSAISSLEMPVSGGGANFSVGQRQLLCLARAILRNNRILILDEATANIDAETDALIQKTIRRKFQDCTVLTIAHRLNTIMDSDRVLVMEAGEIVEFDQPYSLLQNKESIFAQMVQNTGPSMAEHLESIAKEAFLQKKGDDETALDEKADKS